MIDGELYDRIEAWRRVLAERPSVAVHYGDALPVSYSVRTALLIGVEELKDTREGLIREYEDKGPPRPLGVSMPLWFIKVLDSEAERHGLKRNQYIRLALEWGLPRSMTVEEARRLALEWGLPR